MSVLMHNAEYRYFCFTGFFGKAFSGLARA